MSDERRTARRGADVPEHVRRRAIARLEDVEKIVRGTFDPEDIDSLWAVIQAWSHGYEASGWPTPDGDARATKDSLDPKLCGQLRGSGCGHGAERRSPVGSPDGLGDGWGDYRPGPGSDYVDAWGVHHGSGRPGWPSGRFGFGECY